MIKRVRTATPPDEAVDLSIKSLSRQEFAKRLWNLTMQKGWNQSDLSRAAGVGRDSISNYVRGKTLPTPTVVHKLARALRVEPTELLPNIMEGAIEDEIPSLEMREAHGMPGKVWMRINRMVSMSTAAQIFALIESEKDT